MAERPNLGWGLRSVIVSSQDVEQVRLVHPSTERRLDGATFEDGIVEPLLTVPDLLLAILDRVCHHQVVGVVDLELGVHSVAPTLALLHRGPLPGTVEADTRVSLRDVDGVSPGVTREEHPDARILPECIEGVLLL